MKGICPPTSRHRELALESFASLVSSIPFDTDQAGKARDDVVKVGGKELLVEACAVAGAFEAITKLVDATGCQLMSRQKTKINIFIMKTFKNRNTIGAVATAIAVAAVAVSMSTMRR